MAIFLNRSSKQLPEKQTVKEPVSKPTKRAPRYLIQAPLQYRVRGERTWQAGVTHNISDSGILFVGDRELRPGARLEGRLTLPLPLQPHQRVSITFQAEVTRCAEDGTWAARISVRRLCRTGGSPERRPCPVSSIQAPRLQGESAVGL